MSRHSTCNYSLTVHQNTCVTVDRSCSSGVAINYVLPVLRMTSCFRIMDPMLACRYRNSCSLLHGMYLLRPVLDDGMHPFVHGCRRGGLCDTLLPSFVCYFVIAVFVIPSAVLIKYRRPTTIIF